MIDTSKGPKLTREECAWLIAVYEASEGGHVDLPNMRALDPTSLFDEEASHRWTVRGFRVQFERVVRAHNTGEAINSPLPRDVTINRFSNGYTCFHQGRPVRVEPLRAEAMRKQLETE